MKSAKSFLLITLFASNLSLSAQEKTPLSTQTINMVNATFNYLTSLVDLSENQDTALKEIITNNVLKIEEIHNNPAYTNNFTAEFEAKKVAMKEYDNALNQILTPEQQNIIKQKEIQRIQQSTQGTPTR